MYLDLIVPDIEELIPEETGEESASVLDNNGNSYSNQISKNESFTVVMVILIILAVAVVVITGKIIRKDLKNI